MEIDERAYEAAIIARKMYRGHTPKGEYKVKEEDAAFLRAYFSAVSQQPDDCADKELVADVVDEYLHWRRVNPHIKGGENYLKRLRNARPMREAMQPDDWTAEVLDALRSYRSSCLFNADTNEYGATDGWKTTAATLQRLIATAAKRESIDLERYEVLARTLESIHGDAECLLKRARNEGVGKTSAINICSEIARKCRAIRHLYKDWLFSLSQEQGRRGRDDVS